MTDLAGATSTRLTRAGLLPVVLGCCGLAGAVAVRVAVAGPAGAASPLAGLVFAAALVALAAALGVRTPLPRWRPVLIGLLAAGVLCLGPVFALGSEHTLASADGFLPWAVVVSVVAVAEEMLLRGALFDAVTRWRGNDLAVLITAIAFALLHVPVYGWRVLPLDLAVGLGLGALRLWTAGVTAPAVAHVGADLVGWWIR
jgi:membrane protease YdiL (CAAX protease family)